MDALEFRIIQQRLGMTNKQVAESLAVSVTTIERWRSGRRNISRSMANAIEMLKKSLQKQDDRPVLS